MPLLFLAILIHTAAEAKGRWGRPSSAAKAAERKGTHSVPLHRAAGRHVGRPAALRAFREGSVERVLLVLVDVVLRDNGGRHDDLAGDLRRHELGEALALPE